MVLMVENGWGNSLLLLLKVKVIVISWDEMRWDLVVRILIIIKGFRAGFLDVDEERREWRCREAIVWTTGVLFNWKKKQMNDRWFECKFPDSTFFADDYFYGVIPPYTALHYSLLTLYVTYFSQSEWNTLFPEENEMVTRVNNGHLSLHTCF